MKKFILSPCGTSILTNQANTEERRILIKYANAKTLEEIPEDEREIIKKVVERVSNSVTSLSIEDAAKFSAELNCITKIYNNNFSNNNDDFHQLLCTDTFLGETTANIVKQWLEDKGFTVSVRRQEDLQTKDLPFFTSALSEIAKFCEEIITQYRKNGYYIIFNLTGGFKSVQGFLQTLATFYADESVYIFETAKDLLRIPKLPVKISAYEEVKNNIYTLRRLHHNLKVDDLKNISETMYIEIDNEYMLSPWGEIIFNQVKDKIYSEGLLPSPSPKIKYSEKFIKQVSQLSPDRIKIINTKIDYLAIYLESNYKKNLSSFDFKQLKTDKLEPSTHEIDAWSDQDAKRLFGHFEKDIFIIDKLDKGLH